MNKKRTRWTQDTIINRFREIHGDRFDYSHVKFKTVNDKVEIICPKHGMFSQLAEQHLSGRGCRQCSQENNAQSARKAKVSQFDFDKIQQEIREKYAGRIELIEHLKDAPSFHLLHRCQCGTEFRASTADTRRGFAACPTCSKNRSNGEIELFDFVQSLCPDVTANFKLKGYEIDVFCPTYSVGFEYHGLFYHSERKTHRLKYQIAKDHGIRLIQIYEDEWREHRKAVEHIIRYAMGMSDPVFARKCSVDWISSQEAKAWLSDHHVQGGVDSKHNVTLTHDGAVIAVAQFSRPVARRKRSSAGVYELARFASSKRVVGGLSKVIAAFRKQFKPRAIVTYCDHRYFSGDSYLAVGFVARDTRVDYEYLLKDKRFHKSVFQKQNIRKHFGEDFMPGATESEMTKAIGARKLWNAGRTTYVLGDVSAVYEEPAQVDASIPTSVDEMRKTTREKISANSKKNWSNPEFREKMLAKHRSKENIERILQERRLKGTRRWSHPEHGEFTAWHQDLMKRFGGSHSGWCMAAASGKQYRGWVCLNPKKISAT